MKRHKIIELLLLSTVAITGCNAPPDIKTVEKVPLTATVLSAGPAKSCVERSADTLPPKSPVVELVWCVAETDELYDPDHLFRETLGIAKYTTSQGIAWGLKATAGGEENVRLPKGMRTFQFMRRNPKGINEPGNRYVSIEINPKDVCVTMENVKATFGKDAWLSPAPISVPSLSIKGLPPSSLSKKLNPYGIFYKSPRLFMGDVNGSVAFDFQYEECVRNISVQRSIDLADYHKFQKGEK